MQSSNQQPAQEGNNEALRGREIAAEQGQLPLYEFPADSSLAQNGPQSPTPAQDLPQGLIYPPPPSFYQNMQVSAERPSLPPPLAARQVPVSSGQPGSVPPVYPYGPPGQSSPPGLPPGWRQAPVKRPRKRTWVIVAIIAAVVLLLCGLAGWAFYSLFSTVAQQMNGITNVAQDFYQHMQDRSKLFTV